ncbi:MAG: aldo/keto reductase, partial [Chloroflexi bacterium]|nr:aldo/keto reductase [Chloroflexota bacterium]
MEKRYLGKSRLEVSAIGLGCMGMTGIYGPVDDAASIATIHLALDMGVTLLDTSDMYGWGQNEVLLGKALKGRRHQAIVATKFGNIQGKDGAHGGVSGKPEYVKQACEACLKRLGVDY